jgi:hypothetical protein
MPVLSSHSLGLSRRAFIDSLRNPARNLMGASLLGSVAGQIAPPQVPSIVPPCPLWLACQPARTRICGGSAFPCIPSSAYHSFRFVHLQLVLSDFVVRAPTESSRRTHVLPAVILLSLFLILRRVLSSPSTRPNTNRRSLQVYHAN